MNGDGSRRGSDVPNVVRGTHHNRIDAIAWALFFIWVGISILTDLGWGWFLVGLGIIVLGAQAAQSREGAPIDGFWIVSGAVFLAGGLWQLLGLTWPLAPLLLILLGAAMLWKALLGQPGQRP